MAGTDDTARPRTLREWLTSPIAAVAAAAVTIAVVAFVALDSGDDDDPASGPPPAANPPETVTASELASLSESLGRPIYWAGAQGGSTKYELTRQGDERIVVRYPAAPGADAAQGTLTVATYKLDDAQEAIRRAARAETATLHKLPRDGLAVSDTAKPTNVYLAFPKEPYQVEVFDPMEGRALRLVLRNRIRPVR